MTSSGRDGGSVGNRGISRRRLLEAGLGVAAAGLAGCVSDDGSDGGSPKEGNHWVAKHGMTASEYQDEFDTNVDDEGLRLVDVSGYEVGGEERYAAIWADVAGPRWIAHHGQSPSAFDSSMSDHESDGYRPTTLSVYTIDGAKHFASIWEQYDGPAWELDYDLTSSEYQNRVDDLVDEGYRPTDVTGYTVAGFEGFAAIFEQFDGPQWAARHGQDSSDYQSEFDDLTSQDHTITDVGGYGYSGEARYVGVWQQFDTPAVFSHHGLTSSEFQSQFEDYLDRGFRLTDVSGYEVDGSPRYAGIWREEEARQVDFGGIDDTVASYVRSNRVPGLSLAITKDERLVFAKGYGYANRESGARMRPDTLLRIASISKPITGVAILKLMEDGQLSLDDRVFGTGGLLGTAYGTPTHGYASGGGSTTNITVHHLLQHSAGWTNNGGDPMFMHPEMDHSELIGWVLSNRPLQYEPGTSSTYLNFGYCLLGRVVEAVSGQDYEGYVRDEVLSPAGIEDMTIAGDTRSERLDDEAAYYGRNDPYGMQVARMDAHGGWIASPTDLLRLTVHVDGFSNVADILGQAALNELSDVEGAWQAYGEGWVLGSNWRGHDGCFNGGVGYLVRRDDGISYTVLANTRPRNDSCAGTIQSRIDTLVGNVSDWPSHDLF